MAAGLRFSNSPVPHLAPSCLKDHFRMEHFRLFKARVPHPSNTASSNITLTVIT